MNAISLKSITRPGRRRLLLASLLVVGMALTALLCAPGARAADRELDFSFDRGIINLGSTTGVKIVDPDLSPADNPATLGATLAEDGSISAPPSAFTFPVKRITNLETGQPALAVVDAKIEISATGNISGTYDNESGAAAITIPTRADITVYPAGSPASVAKCRVEGFNLEMLTTGTLTDPATDPPTDYPAAVFDASSHEGAVVDSWEGLPESTIISGGLASLVCPAVNGLIGGPGGLWLSGTATIGGEAVSTAPTMAPNITSAPPATTNVGSAEFAFEPGTGETQIVNKYQCRLDSTSDSDWASCDSGTQSYTGLTAGHHKFEVRAGNDLGYGPTGSFEWEQTGGENPCTESCGGGKPKLGNLTITPKNKAVKRGKKATIIVKVKNAGDAAATGAKVCVTAPKKLVTVKKCVSVGQIAAGKTKTAKFKVKVKKKAKKGKKVVLKFKATASGVAAKNGKATVKVK